ncbi:MAG TPA: Mur ligase family protein [Candidatus Limnocylindria bacterium]|nr:Mur ligase family protein [Candidatus Limnocylindria bacterium]
MAPEPEAEPQPSDTEVDLVELRVLDGPNRFFTRPAVKLEFRAEEPGRAAEAAASAALAVRRLHVALDLPEPKLTARHSTDGQRSAVAFPWRRRTISQAIAASAARLALGKSTERRELSGLRAVAHGPLAHLPRPRIPIVAVTGTNGKSTTTRLIAHILAAAGRAVGMTNSDGIYVRGELVEAGDWTGFGGASRILAEPGLDVAVLETARGGILLRGIGYAANDVSVVTNISADHLGLQGIDTLDEMAEVKSTVARITRRDGWSVLNADDPRVWQMRRLTKANIYAFSLDPRSGTVEAALDAGGRAAVLDRGRLVLRGAGRRPRGLLRVEDVPVTFGGLSRFNIANALAAAAAADALGLTTRQINAGLRSFGQEADANPGRLNLFERDGTFALVDFAHNEAGMAGLLEVARAVARRGRVRLAFGTAGDRTDEILFRMGGIAARADDLVIAEKEHYLRGRDLGEMNELLRSGAREGGYAGEIEAHPSELQALRVLLDRARRGDVACVMAHVERRELFAWLREQGFRAVTPEDLRRLVAGRAAPAG